MTVMLIMMLFAPSQASYHSTELRENQTVYFDKIGSMRLIRNEWKLVAFYDMSAYWEGMTLARKYIDHLENLCQKIKEVSHCPLVLLHLHHCQSELEHYNDILTNHGQLPDNHRRIRRGFVNGIGSLARSLFGVLDDEFAQQYQNDLYMMKRNQKYLNQLLQNQTSIIESEYDVIQRIQKTIKQQHKTFNEHLENLDTITNKMQKQIQDNTYSNEFALSSITANGLLMNLKDIQQMLLDTITDIFHGKVNIHLIQPEQLTKELLMISSQISSDLSLPIDNVQTSLSKIYHLMTVKTRFTEAYLIFEIKIPLIDRNNFDLFKLIPIPKEIGNQMQKIVVESDLLAINIQKDLQIPFQESQLNQCINFDTDILLCAHQIPITMTKNHHNYCITENQPSICKTERLKCKNTWIQLHKVNNYLYSCCGQCSIQIICDSQIALQPLNNSGIIALQNGCVIKDEGITLLSQKEFTSDIKLKPDIIHIDIPTINNIVNIPMPPTTTNDDTSSPNIELQLKLIRNNIESVKNQTKSDIGEESMFLNNHDVHHYIAIYIIAGAGITACLLFCARKIRGRDQRRAAAAVTAESPAPAPPRPQPRAHRLTPHHQCLNDSSDQCTSFSVSDNNQVNDVYATVKRVKCPQSFNFSVVE